MQAVTPKLPALLEALRAAAGLTDSAGTVQSASLNGILKFDRFAGCTLRCRTLRSCDSALSSFRSRVDNDGLRLPRELRYQLNHNVVGRP